MSHSVILLQSAPGGGSLQLLITWRHDPRVLVISDQTAGKKSQTG